MVEGFDQSREGPGELVCLVQVLTPTLEGLLTNHRASVALHGGVMARDRLTDQHPLEHVARLYVHHGSERRFSPALIEIRVIPPQSSNDLTSEDDGEILVIGTADRPSNSASLCRMWDLDLFAPLLGRRRHSFLLSLVASLRSRSRA